MLSLRQGSPNHSDFWLLSSEFFAIMPFFRRNLDIALARVRPPEDADITAVSRLLRDSAHRFLGAESGDLPALLHSAPALMLANGRDLWGCIIAGWPTDDATWVRALAFADGLPIGDGFDTLLPPFEPLLGQRGVRRLFYAGDASADEWTQPALLKRGWVRQTNVVVYEKHGHAIPSGGNQNVRIRRAQSIDLPTVIALDRISFDAQWVKDEGILGPAIVEQPFFMIAELNGLPAGYAFATSHFSGKLLHLVRIAVDPSTRGQGVGVRLMAELIQFARNRGAETLTLNTQAENRTAQRLYEWFGFERTGESQTVLRRDLS